EMNAILTRGHAQRRRRVVRHSHRIERMVGAGMKEDRARANGAFGLLRKRDGQRMVLPIDQVGRRGVRPLMRAEPPFALTVVPVKQIEKMPAARMKKRHAVADMRVETARRPVLAEGQWRTEDAPLALLPSLASAGKRQHFI